jgi:hypothetical protein
MIREFPIALKLICVWVFASVSMTLSLAGQHQPPRFEDFPISERFHGKPMPVRLASREARRYRTAIREGVKEGPNFAGHYTIVEIGCGSACVLFAVVDAKTGAVYFQPFPISYGMMEDQKELLKSYPQHFRIDSRLLVVYGSRKNDGKGMYFYKWERDRFKLIYTALKKK